jgi:hypothetical protein
MTRVQEIVFDCRHPASLARFWAAVLDGFEPRLCFQLIPESKIVKNRVHLDLRCDDLEAEARRLVDLGARVLATTAPRPGWVVLADPEGNEFCLAGPKPA